jgi:excisionase family DNA binding protein
VPEVAERLRVSPETVRRYLRRGWLRGVVLGGRSTGYRIEEEELARFLAANRGVSVVAVAEERARYRVDQPGQGSPGATRRRRRSGSTGASPAGGDQADEGPAKKAAAA